MESPLGSMDLRCNRVECSVVESHPFNRKDLAHISRGELINLQKNKFIEIVFLWCLSNLNGINNMCVKFFGKKLAGSVPLEVRKLRF